MIIFSWSPTPTQYAAGLANIRRELQDMSEPLERSVDEVMTASIEDNFLSGGRPAWAPLAAFTIDKKGHDDILIDSGDLMDDASSMFPWDIEAKQAVLRDVEDYGKHQNYGFFNVPFGSYVEARPWALFQTEDEDDIEEVFWQWLEIIVEDSLP